MMTREDILRELELLPVWQLRTSLQSTPVQSVSVGAEPANVVVEKAVSKEVETEPVEARAANVKLEDAESESAGVGGVQQPAAQYLSEASLLEVHLPEMRLMVSDDSHWLFLLEPTHSGEAEALLKNILKAIPVNLHVDVVNANKQHLKQYSPQMIVVMGEAPAQSLLGVSEMIDVLRDGQHQYESVPVVVTYSPTHLLLNLADKAKVWEDLCAARSVVQAHTANKV